MQMLVFIWYGRCHAPLKIGRPVWLKKIILNLKIFVQNLSSLTVLVFCSRYVDFIIYFIWEESRPFLLYRLFLFKIFIFKLKLLVQKLRTLAVTLFQIYRFLYLLYMVGATPTILFITLFIIYFIWEELRPFLFKIFILKL